MIYQFDGTIIANDFELFEKIFKLTCGLLAYLQKSDVA
jgi:hypothetical protein